MRGDGSPRDPGPRRATQCYPSLQEGRPPGLGKHCFVSQKSVTLRGNLTSHVAWQGLCLNTAHARLSEWLPWTSLPGQSSWGCDAPSGFQAPRCRAGERGTWPLQQSRDFRPQRGARIPSERRGGLARAGLSGGSQSPAQPREPTSESGPVTSCDLKVN